MTNGNGSSGRCSATSTAATHQAITREAQRTRPGPTGALVSTIALHRAAAATIAAKGATSSERADGRARRSRTCSRMPAICSGSMGSRLVATVTPIYSDLSTTAGRVRAARRPGEEREEVDEHERHGHGQQRGGDRPHRLGHRTEVVGQERPADAPQHEPERDAHEQREDSDRGRLPGDRTGHLPAGEPERLEDGEVAPAPADRDEQRVALALATASNASRPASTSGTRSTLS